MAKEWKAAAAPLEVCRLPKGDDDGNEVEKLVLDAERDDGGGNRLEGLRDKGLRGSGDEGLVH